jgi:hypothetical protein
VVFAGCNRRAPYSAVGKWNGANVFGNDARVLDAVSARPGDPLLFGNRKSNDDKTGRRE